MSLDFFPCKVPISYDASYVCDACNVLVKSYSKSILAATHSIVLVKSSTGPSTQRAQTERHWQVLGPTRMSPTIDKWLVTTHTWFILFGFTSWYFQLKMRNKVSESIKFWSHFYFNILYYFVSKNKTKQNKQTKVNKTKEQHLNKKNKTRPFGQTYSWI